MEAGSPSKLVFSLCWSEEVEGLTLRSRRVGEKRLERGDGGGDDAGAALLLLPLLFAEPVLGGASLKTWTVSVAEETHNSVEVALKLMQYMRAGMLPLRNWYSFLPSAIEKILITVPFSDAVAMSVPSLLIATNDNGV